MSLFDVSGRDRARLDMDIDPRVRRDSRHRAAAAMGGDRDRGLTTLAELRSQPHDIAGDRNGLHVALPIWLRNANRIFRAILAGPFPIVEHAALRADVDVDRRGPRCASRRIAARQVDRRLDRFPNETLRAELMRPDHLKNDEDSNATALSQQIA